MPRTGANTKFLKIQNKTQNTAYGRRELLTLIGVSIILFVTISAGYLVVNSCYIDGQFVSKGELLRIKDEPRFNCQCECGGLLGMVKNCTIQNTWGHGPPIKSEFDFFSHPLFIKFLEPYFLVSSV